MGIRHLYFKSWEIFASDRECSAFVRHFDLKWSLCLSFSFKIIC